MSEFHFREGRWRKGPGVVPLADRLWRFGDGFFETVRVEDGKPCLWLLHEKRLKRSLRTLALPAFNVDLFPLPRLAGVAALRIFLSSGTGSGLAQRGPLTVYASLAPYRAVTKALRVASFVRTERAYADVKTPAYLEAIVALRRKRVDDLIACDARGHVLESASGNVIAFVGGRWVTPPLDGRVLPGTTREALLPLLKERPLKLTALLSADAVVLTSALRGITPVSRIDGALIARGETLTRALSEAYRREMERR